MLTHVARKPQKAEIERISAESSRLLDAVSRTAGEREHRAVIFYSQAMEAQEDAGRCLKHFTE